MTDEAKALVERSETIRSQMYLDLVANDAQHKEMLALIETQAREIERLQGVLTQIADGTMPRPLGKPWRMDMTSSKHDRCAHGAWMYEPCEGCIDAFIAAALEVKP